ARGRPASPRGGAGRRRARARDGAVRRRQDAPRDPQSGAQRGRGDGTQGRQVHHQGDARQAPAGARGLVLRHGAGDPEAHRASPLPVVRDGRQEGRDRPWARHREEDRRRARRHGQRAVVEPRRHVHAAHSAAGVMKARGAFAAFAPMGGALVVSLATAARGDVPLPPWVEEGELPPPAWAQSVARRPDDSGLFGDPDEAAGAPAGSSRTGTEGPTGLVLFTEPNRASGRRGVSSPGATLPFFGTKRGSGCSGAWWLVGALAWTCSDDAVLSTEAPSAPARMLDGAGL